MLFSQVLCLFSTVQLEAAFKVLLKNVTWFSYSSRSILQNGYKLFGCIICRDNPAFNAIPATPMISTVTSLMSLASNVASQCPFYRLKFFDHVSPKCFKIAMSNTNDKIEKEFF